MLKIELLGYLVFELCYLYLQSVGFVPEGSEVTGRSDWFDSFMTSFKTI